MGKVSGVYGVRLATAVAGCSTLVLVAFLLVLAGRPVATDDLWFHLKLGEAYLAHGLWLDEDPMLHTSSELHKPLTWLFQVVVYSLLQVVGFHGLRVVHVLAVAGILWLAYSMFRRESGSPVAAYAALSVLVVLAWYRFFQFRPHLFSIPAALLLYRLLVEGSKRPTWKEVAASCLLLCVWANAHSLFLLGPLLLSAALLGLALKALALEWMRARPTAEGQGELAAARGHNFAAMRRLLAAVSLGLLATSINPRGPKQELAFFQYASTAVWGVGDEWRHFNPFAFDYTDVSVSLLAWLAADTLIVAFAALAAIGLVGFLRRPSLSILERIDPVLFGLGLASLVAILGSIRFLWMALFPLLFLLRSLRVWQAGRGEPQSAVVWALTGLCVVLLVASPGAGGMQQRAEGLPATVRAYFRRPVAEWKYYPEGVHFLRAAGVRGNLFNVYYMGGYLGFWLAPELRTFVDGRTHPELMRDLDAVLLQRGGLPGESFLDVLDRRRVDVFFGVAMPAGSGGKTERIYTVTLLERAGDDWILVSRSIRHAIYLRRGARNEENLERVAAYYEKEGVPFDRVRGFAAAAVVRERPDWAMANHMLPRAYPRLVRASESGPAAARFGALDYLGNTYALLGLYDLQIATDREAVALRPRSKAPRRRLVAAHLRREELREATEAARALLRLDPDDPRSRALFGAVSYFKRALDLPVKGREPDALLNRVALLSWEERARFLERF